MKNIVYKYPKCEGTLSITNLENNTIRIYVEDSNGHHASILIPINDELGKILETYIEEKKVLYK